VILGVLFVVKKERRESRDMETITEQEYLTGGQSVVSSQPVTVAASSDSKDNNSTTATDEDDPFFGMLP